jgi:hypothetical protein
MIQERFTDRAFLIAALESRFVSADLLDRLANSPDLGIELQVARNPNSRSETLTRLYRTCSYPPYLHQALAAHSNTPPDILREIYSARRQFEVGYVETWLARNPATPKDTLDDIARHGQ